MTVAEEKVLAELESGEVVTVDELVVRLPELTFGALFLALDTLSRRGDVLMRRRGFEYEVWIRKELTEARAPAELLRGT